MHSHLHSVRTALTMAAGLAAALAASAALADDPNAAMRAVSLGVQRDAGDNQSVLGTLSLPVAQRQWVQFSGGRTRTEQDRARVLGAGVGTIGEGWLASLNATHRRDGERFRQTDWMASVEWQAESFDIGLDGSYRDARRRDPALPTVQRIKGAGIGVHGGVMLGERTRLYGAAMHYDLRRDGGSAPAPTLVQALTERSPLVAREEVALRRSLQAGLGQRFDIASVNLEYLGDKLLGDASTVHTVQLKAGFEPARGWTVTPAIGRSRGAGEGVNFGALSLAHRW